MKKMCGIVGYVGMRTAAPVLLDGLSKLEYRGYDSAGLAVHDGQQIGLVRAVGKLDNLVRAASQCRLDGSIGVGHTRWATHGRPSESNAHPHRAGDVVVVHNGIIENHGELRLALLRNGVRFASETDTEVVAHLIDRELKRSESLRSAVRAALKQVRGAYALAVMSRLEPGRLIVAKHASPLVVGIGEGELLCASDAAALLSYTREVVFLEDGDLGELTRTGLEVEGTQGSIVPKQPRRIGWDPVQAEKAGYKHFMLKEIFEQPLALKNTIEGRFNSAGTDLIDEELGLDPEIANGVERVCLVACGTSHHAALAGRYWIEQLARVPAQVELASEVRYRDPVFRARDLVIAVSQSGETADTLAALHAAREAGARVLAIANVVDSAIPRAAHGALYTHAGPEIGVASTKCFTTQLAALLMIATYLGRRLGALSAEETAHVVRALREVPDAVQAALERKAEVYGVARRWQAATDMLFLGRGLGFPIALEGALKLKEISYAHAEGYAAGELKHGPLALIDERVPVVALLPRDRHYDKTLSNVHEVRARDGQVIGVVMEDDVETGHHVQYLMRIPNVPELVLPFVTIVPLQLLAYYIADLKGRDVDQPRNLAKTVTVE